MEGYLGKVLLYVCFTVALASREHHGVEILSIGDLLIGRRSDPSMIPGPITRKRYTFHAVPYSKRHQFERSRERCLGRLDLRLLLVTIEMSVRHTLQNRLFASRSKGSVPFQVSRIHMLQYFISSQQGSAQESMLHRARKTSPTSRRG